MKGARITERQQQMLAFIEAYVVETGRRPTREQICLHLGLSSTSIGYVTRVLGHFARFKEIDFLRKRVRDLEAKLKQQVAA